MMGKCAKKSQECLVVLWNGAFVLGPPRFHIIKTQLFSLLHGVDFIIGMGHSNKDKTTHKNGVGVKVRNALWVTKQFCHLKFLSCQEGEEDWLLVICQTSWQSFLNGFSIPLFSNSFSRSFRIFMFS